MRADLTETREEMVSGFRVPDSSQTPGSFYQKYPHPGRRSGTQQCVYVQHHDPERTVLGKKFLSLPREYDSLEHAISHIKHAQKLCAHKTPGLWKQAKGINDDIAVKTARFIVDTAIKYDVDCIVMEHLDLAGKKRGSKKQRLHLWRAKYIQAMVVNKAHRNMIRIARVCAWNTSRLAFDGTGRVQRGKEAELPSYSLCRFPTGKQYNCDLNASYNIGSRYYIRELLKTLPVTAGRRLQQTYRN